MLVLSRLKNESIVIRAPDGTAITVMVCDIRRWGVGGEKVRLGIDAPTEYRIDREEVAAAAAEPTYIPDHPPQTDYVSHERGGA